MQPKTVYLLLCIAGFAIPYSQFVPWLLEHGLNLRLFVQELLANRISAFFGADVLVSAVAVCIFARFEQHRLGRARLLPLLAVLLCGVSLALPLLLYLRETDGQVSGATPSAVM